MHLISLLKKELFILNTVFTRSSFNFHRLFGFVEQNPSLDKLRGLLEALLPFCKKFPQKVFEVLVGDWCTTTVEQD